MIFKQTPAVVLKVLDYGESDKIVTFYCPDTGKLTGIAKGAKRSSKRFVNKLELFSLLDLSYSTRNRNTMAQIIEAELLDPFIALRNDYDRYVAASLIIELVLNWSRENDADEALFPLLLWTLHCLDHGRPPGQVVIFFQMKLLDIAGYRPSLSGCVKCNRFDQEGRPYGFSISRSGLICSRCFASTTFSSLIPLSLSTIRLLQNVQDLPLEKLNRLRFSASSVREAITMLKQYGEYLLQRQIHSWKALGGE